MMLHVGKQTGIQTAESMLAHSHHARMDWLTKFLVLRCDNSCHKELMFVITCFVYTSKLKK
jgi:hypothetical protein